jgi:hypothetical protein
MGGYTLKIDFFRSNFKDGRSIIAHLGAPNFFKNVFKKSHLTDLLTLSNEYEVLIFSNYIIHKLFDGKEDMVSMGTFVILKS